MGNFPEWGNGITKETPQILPPVYFYFKKEEMKKMKLEIKKMRSSFSFRNPKSEIMSNCNLFQGS